ncbi:MAG TPA: PilZ domain-containing protein [Allosphingosinicella sp.]|nr:PilZ domain-containing protein [Allosphingosinicella sp.]
MGMTAARDPSRPASLDRRDAMRTPVSVPVLVDCGDRRQTAQLHNLSEGGAMVETPVPLVKGEPVVVTCGLLKAEGVIAWQEDHRAGIVFGNPLDEMQIARQILQSSAGSQRRPNDVAPK